MAEVTITISDNDEGTAQISIDFDPPVNEKTLNTPAVLTALKMVEYSEGMHQEEDK